MAASADQKSSSTSGDDRNLVTIDENYLAPTFEDKLLMFWEKNGRAVVTVVVVAALAIVARWAFTAYAESRERAIAAEYAAAKDTAGLKAFAQAHPEAELAGVAQLRIADEAYVAGNFAAAQADYEAAAKTLSGQVLGDRARLGAAISKLQAGDAAGGKAALEALAKDVVFTRTLRAEAAFHLALQARDAGQSAEAKKMIELVSNIEPAGFWAQRATQLQSTLPADPAPAAAAPAPAASTPAPVEATPSVSFPGTK
jgi:hypothetical protein